MGKKNEPTIRQIAFNFALRKLHADSGMTQMELADAVGVSQAHVNSILKKPNWWGREDVRLKIINVLSPGTSYEEFIEYGNKLIMNTGYFDGYSQELIEKIKQFKIEYAKSGNSPPDSLRNHLALQYDDEIESLRKKFYYILNKLPKNTDTFQAFKYQINTFHDVVVKEYPEDRRKLKNVVGGKDAA
ncbi:MAG: hypothetical protein LBJ14_10365 [Desulfarculales bacterium]|jgi:DNA-binding XRE family transcriptional regulator|nr:hypothetical protein [Desulfarculales bacterium]